MRSSRPTPGVIPAPAGIHPAHDRRTDRKMDSRVRGNDIAGETQSRAEETAP